MLHARLDARRRERKRDRGERDMAEGRVGEKRVERAAGTGILVYMCTRAGGDAFPRAHALQARLAGSPTNLYPTALICALFYAEENGRRRVCARARYTRAKARAYISLGPPNNYSLYVRFMHLGALTDCFNEGNRRATSARRE